MKFRTFVLAGILGVALSAPLSPLSPLSPIAAYAASLGGAGPAAVVSAPLAEQVQYRRGWGGPGYGYRGFGYRGYGYGWGRPGPWIGLGAGIAAGTFIYSQTYLPRRGAYYDTYAYDGPYYYPANFEGDRRDLCARYFKSFEWRTGLYTTYGGDKRLCPYLRE